VPYKFVDIISKNRFVQTKDVREDRIFHVDHSLIVVQHHPEVNFLLITHNSKIDSRVVVMSSRSEYEYT